MKNMQALTAAITESDKLTNQFFNDVVKGLRSEPKTLDSKYFYDAVGDKLFQDLMDCEEYYPTKCELDIFANQTAEVCKTIMDDSAFDLIELGAGDATKSSYLLRYLIAGKVDFTYLPIDISENIISYLTLTLPVSIPGINIQGLNGEYFQMLTKAREVSDRRKVVMFLGSNIGNMPVEVAQSFCVELRKHLSPGDMVLMGFDLKKNPAVVLAAYNDKDGITRRFNLNLLERINRELGGNFKVDKFAHYPTYDPETGSCKSYLISLEAQTVQIGDEKISFAKDEYIYMEISQKFTLAQTEEMASKAGFKTLASFTDSKGWFVDTVWEAI